MLPQSKTASRGRMYRASLLPLLFGGLLATNLPALAQKGEALPEALVAARARFADLDFEGALLAFSALLDNTSTPARTRAAALTGRGLCQQVLGRPKEARASFLEALSIDPKQTLPEDTSPKLRRPFLAARKVFQKEYVPRLSLDRDALARGTLLIIGRDPLDLIRSVEILLSARGKHSTLKARARGDGTFEALPELHGALRLRARAVNAHGIEIASLGAPRALAIRLPRSTTPGIASTMESSTSPDERLPHAPADPPIATTPPPPDDPAVTAPPPPPRERIPDSSPATVAVVDPTPETTPSASGPQAPSNRPLVYGFAGGATAALGGAIALGLSARGKARAFNGDPTRFASHSEALATGRAARNQALGANLLYGGAALLAASAALFTFWDPGLRSSPDAFDDPVFALAPTPDGALLLLGGRFR